MDYTAHGTLQARILEWGAFPFSRASFQPRDQTQVSLIAGGSFTGWATRQAHKTYKWHEWLGQKWLFKCFQGPLGCSTALSLRQSEESLRRKLNSMTRHKARSQEGKPKGTKRIARHGFFSADNLDLRPWPEVELASLGSKSSVFVRGSFWSISWASSTRGTSSKKGAGGRQNTQMGSARKSRWRTSVSGKLASVKSVLAFNKRVTGRPDSHGSLFTITCTQNILNRDRQEQMGAHPWMTGEADTQKQSHAQVWSWVGPSDRVDGSSGRSSHCGTCPRPGKPPDSKRCTCVFQALKPLGLTLSSDVGAHRSLLQLLLVAKRTNSGSRFIPTVLSSYAWEDSVKI